MNTIFECHFEFGGGVSVVSVEAPSGMLTFINGFWLDDDYNLVLEEQGGDPIGLRGYRDRQSIWIPPHRIKFITRKTYETGEAA